MGWFGTDHNSGKKHKTISRNKSGYTKKGGSVMNMGVGRRRTRNIDDVINMSVRGKKKK